jgi:hypothetical protein
MDNIEKQFEDFIDNIKFDDVPSTGHRDKLEWNLLAAMNAPSLQTRQFLGIWRTFMKTKIAKFATAAVITITLILSIMILNQSASPAWAIEQSIEALDPFRAISVEGLESERTWREDGSLELRPFRSWAVANEDQTMVEKYRTEVYGFLILTTNGQKTWRYDPNTNTVRIENRPYVASECWFGSRLLEQLKDGRDKGVFTHWEVTYGKDPATGGQRVFLKAAWLNGRYNGPRSMWIEFDMKSMLPVSFKQWENSNWDGPATLIAEKLTYYKNLPDDLFEFKVPEGATVIEEK